jgi:hypothetical protein
MPGRCAPHRKLWGTASGLGGHGSSERLNVPLHVAFGAGAPSVYEAKGTLVVVPSGLTFTSQAPTTSISQGASGSRVTAL